MSRYDYNVTKYLDRFPENELRELLKENTYRELQEKTGYSERLFSALAKHYGIPRNDKLLGIKRNRDRIIKFDYQTVYDMYINQHKSTRDIAEFYNCEHCTVNTYMKNNGIPIRDAHDPICYESRLIPKPYVSYGIDTGGYISVSVNGERTREHRYVMEQHLGRPLKSDEYVHHIDFNKTNNDINNLFLFPNNELHIMYHAYLKNNDYISPDDFLLLYKDTIDEYLSKENLFNLYIKENKSIKEIATMLAEKLWTYAQTPRSIVKSYLVKYGLFDANNVDINQYIKKDVSQWVNNKQITYTVSH